MQTDHFWGELDSSSTSGGSLLGLVYQNSSLKNNERAGMAPCLYDDYGPRILID